MATSVGVAAAQGLESGFGLGMRGRQQALDEEERRRRAAQADAELASRGEDRKLQRERDARNDTRLATQDKRQAKQDARQTRMDELKMLDQEYGELQTEGSGLWTQYGGFDKVPEDVRGQYTGRVKQLRDRRSAARRSFYEPDVTEAKRDAAEKWSRIQAGQMTLDELSDDDLYRTLTVQTRRDLADFLRPKEGGPAPIEQAALDLEAGMQTGNMDLTLRAANMLLKPELATGVGSEGRDGSEIVSKRIVQMVPHPQDPGQFVPVVEVTVKRDDGATGKYLAPISEGRGVYANDPEALPKTLSVKDALDRVGQLSTLSGALNRPDLRTRIDKAAAGPGKASADEFLAALGSLGVKAPERKITRDKLDLGGSVIERELDDRGRVVSEKEHKKTPVPRTFSSRGRGLAVALGDVEDHIAAGKSGDELLDALSDGDARIVRGLADGSIKPDSISIRGNRRERMLALAKQYKPDANLAGGGNTKIPAPVLKSLQDARESSAAISGLAERFSADFARKGVFGLGSDMELAANSVLGRDRESVDWWKDYRKQIELVERHALFGAALTESEKGSWRSADINPGMDAKVIQTNIAKRAELAKKVLAATQQDLIDSGYNAERIGSIAGRDVSPPKAAGIRSWGDDAPTLPQAARAALKEGQHTKFSNGQVWTMQGGKPVQVQ